MSRRSKKALQSCVMDTLEQRVLFDQTIDTHFGWRITAPTGVTLPEAGQYQLVGANHDHLLIPEVIDSKGYSFALKFEKTAPLDGNAPAEFFAMDVRATNNSTGSCNQFSMQMYQMDGTGNSIVAVNQFNTLPHPAWAHFHVNGSKAFSHFTSVVPGQPYPNGPMQSVTVDGGEVPQGATFQLGGGMLTSTGSTNPADGFRIHYGRGGAWNDYAGHGFWLYTGLFYKIKPDRYEPNDSPATATDLRTLASDRRDNLTITNDHYNADIDFYKFTAAIDGRATIKALFSNAQGDINLSVLDASQRVIATSNGKVDNESVTIDVVGGSTYFVQVNAADSWYGSQRNYSLDINIARPAFQLYDSNGTLAPENGSVIWYLGSVEHGASNARVETFHIHNGGDQYLYFSLDSVSDGFLLSGLDNNALAPGKDQSFSVRLDSSKAEGAYQGAVKFWEMGKPFSLNLSGTVTPHVAAPEINLYKMNGQQIPFGSSEIFDLGSILSGATTGGSVQFKIRNDGDALLTMSIPTAPSGFRVEGLDATLQPGKEDVLTVRIDSSVAPAIRSGKIVIVSNDSDEGPPTQPGFSLNVKGTVLAAPQLHVFEANGTPIDFNSNKVFDLGSIMHSATNGDWMVFKIRNDGTANLNLSFSKVPTGFVVDGLVPSLEPGHQTGFQVRIDSSKAPGTFSGQVVIASNDTKAAAFGLNLTGIVTKIPKAEISGMVFSDANGDGRRNSNEPAMSDVSVFLDTNGNGNVDAGESSTRSDASGHYLFADVDNGSYRVAVNAEPGWRCTTATAGARTILVNSAADRPAFDFGLTRRASVSGRLLLDRNGNGQRDAGEKYLGGWRVFLDSNRNGLLDAGERVSVTDSRGRWTLNSVSAGAKRQIRLAPPVDSSLVLTGKWSSTTPRKGLLSFNLVDGQTVTDQLFGVKLL